MELPQIETTAPAAGTDFEAMHSEAWRDIFAAKIGLAQMLVLDVVFRYSLRLKRASAWIPSLGVFEMHTGMGKKEIRAALDGLVSFQILEIQDAPAMDLLPQGQFPDGQRYMYFPRNVRAWSISPRITSKRHLERAATIDRWLLAFNAGGDPAQADLFPPLWDHADTLAEWSARSEDPPQVRPDLLPTQSAQPLDFRPASASPLNPGKADRGEKPHADPVGKNPIPYGEKPHGPINRGIELIERQVSHLTHSKPLMPPPVGKNPTPSAAAGAQDAARQPHWPTREVENRLMRRIAELITAWYAPQTAAEIMQKRGGLWRWRIREWPFAVEQAIEISVAHWQEIHKLGEYMNREWKRIWAKRATMRQDQVETAAAAAEPAPTAEELAAGMAEFSAHLAEGET